MSALTSLLVRDGVVPVRKIEEALQRQVISGGDVETVLLEMDAVSENVLAAYRAAVHELTPATREEVSSVPPEVVELVPREVAVEHRIIPLRVTDRTLHVAAHEPLTSEQEERIGFLLGFDLVIHIACDVRIAAGLALHYQAELAPRMIRLVDAVRGRSSGKVPQVGKVKKGQLRGHGADLPDKSAPRGTSPFGTSRSGSFILEPAPPEPGDEPKKKGKSVRPPAERASFADLKRLRGPMTLPAGERLLKRASDRDQIVEVFFAFARQFFDYTALFVVHDDVADGREAYGVGAPTDQVRAMSIPLDVPSAFAEVVRTRVPQVRTLDQTDVDRDISVGLRRPANPPALLMPIAIRQRVVLILYGDRNGELFDIGTAMELVRFGPCVVESLEQLIIRRKRGGYHAADPREVRGTRGQSEIEQDTKAIARRVAARLARTDEASADDGARSPGRGTSPGFAVPEAAHDESRGSVENAPRPVRQAETLPAVEGEPAKEKRKPRRPPSQVLGIPREAPPPPPSAEFDLAALALDGLGQESEGEPEISFEVGGDEDDLDPEDYDEEQDPDEEEEEDPNENPDEEEEREEDAEPEGRAERVSDRPEGAYRSSAAPVDVIRPVRPSDRPRPRSNRPPVRRADRPTPRDFKRARRPNRPSDPRRVEDGESRPEVVRVPDSIRSEPPPPLPIDSYRSVIVDMGAQVHAQVDDLLAASGKKEQDRLIRGILAIGEAALPVLAQAFPGPLTWTRETGGPVPHAGDISPVARAFVTFGPRASSYVAGLLSSDDPEVRLYAAIVASEMVSADLMDAVAECVHDEDSGVRRIAVQLLPRFAGFRGFDEIRSVMRRSARIRGKDLSRRWQAIDALAALRDVEMIPKMVDLLREDDDELEKHLHEALVTLTCTDLGRSHRRWTSWWNRNRNRHRIEWLIEGLVHGHESIRRSAGDELKRLTQEHYGYHAGSPKRDRERVARQYRDWWESDGSSRFA